jgi:D-lactate dehydrogenase
MSTRIRFSAPGVELVGELDDSRTALRTSLEAVLPAERVLTGVLDRFAFATDASVYRRVPRGVVQPASIEEVRGIFRLSHRQRVPLTFRAAGTSLSGQSVTDGILVDVSRHWRLVEVLEEGAAVRVQPGVIAAAVNRQLAPHGAKIGPDPASINACMMGGVLANNSSGMCCGVELNAYRTLASMVFVLPDGTVVDSSAKDAETRFQAEAPEVARGLLELRDRVLADSALCDRIRRKYRMKNTMGYSLNAFLDHTTPVAILSHLMIGSEGTLGFIAEAVLRTVPDYPLKHTGMLFFPDVPAACSAIVPLRESGARALELMDRASLAAVQGRPGVPESIPGLPPTSAALLVEYQEALESELADRVSGCHDLLPGLSLQSEPIFTRDPARQADLWSVRKGLIPSVGAKRRRGTAMIIEDVVFPLEALAEGVRELQDMCAAHHYDDAIVFGHARDGNLHFVLNQRFDDGEAVRGFDAFLRELADLVAVRYDGALKGEHSTGRNMAPFLELEWGPEAVAIMRRVKELVDPESLLNPGVLINDDPQAHITHLKSLEPVEEVVDPCIECGFCERLCPSRDLTRTPRQRIVLHREMTRLRREEPRSETLRQLERDFRHSGIDTCATDGMCATGCPVGIDTGLLVKLLRHRAHPWWRRRLARGMARRFGAVERAARGGLRLAHLARAALGDRGAARVARGGVDPRRGLRPLLWDALRLQGVQGGRRGGGQPARRGHLGMERRRPASGRGGHHPLHPHPPALRPRAGPGPPGALRASGDPRRGRVRPEARRAPPGGPSPAGCRRPPPGVLGGADGSRRAALGRRRAVLHGGGRPGDRRMLWLRRRPRLPGARAHRLGHVRRGPGGPLRRLRRLLFVESHLRDRPHAGHREALPVVLVPAGGGEPAGPERRELKTAPTGARRGPLTPALARRPRPRRPRS